MSEWIPVVERLPEEDDIVLVCFADGVILQDNIKDGKWETYSDSDILAWMPLPEPYEPPKMTLDEAIAHALEVANSKCDACGREHRQLAEWLIELRDFKEKETPKKMGFVMGDYLGDDCYFCPTCNHLVAKNLEKKPERCPFCNQRLLSEKN